MEDNRQTSKRTEYIYAGGRLVAKRVQNLSSTGSNSGSPSTTTIHTDFLGSPVAETSSTGAVIKVERFTPYGEPADMQLDAGPGFTGHATDVATGLIYMQQRYYDAELGRFISPDPVGPEEDFIKHFNRYNYALNNPVRYTDPDGRDADKKPEPIYLNKSELPKLPEDTYSQSENQFKSIGYSYSEKFEWSSETIVKGKTVDVNPEAMPLNLGALYDILKDTKKASGVGIVIDALTPSLVITKTPLYRATVYDVYYRKVMSTTVNGIEVETVEMFDYYKTSEKQVVIDSTEPFDYDYSYRLEH
jgi:RHS repeat-associated protein